MIVTRLASRHRTRWSNGIQNDRMIFVPSGHTLLSEPVAYPFLELKLHMTHRSQRQQASKSDVKKAQAAVSTMLEVRDKTALVCLRVLNWAHRFYQ